VHSDRRSERTREAYLSPGGRLDAEQPTRRAAKPSAGAAYVHRRHYATRITDFYSARRRYAPASGHPPTEFERTISKARRPHSVGPDA
jgi:hypothetical protein